MRVWKLARRASHSAGLNRGPASSQLGHIGPGPPRQHCRLVACSARRGTHMGGGGQGFLLLSFCLFAHLCHMAAPPGWWRVGIPWACWRAEQEAACIPLPGTSVIICHMCTFSKCDLLTCMPIPGPGRPLREQWAHGLSRRPRAPLLPEPVGARDSHRGKACISCSRLCGRLQAPSGAHPAHVHSSLLRVQPAQRPRTGAVEVRSLPSNKPI